MNILITGVSQGLGRATVQALAKAGNHRIFAISRNPLGFEVKGLTSIIFDLGSSQKEFDEILLPQVKKVSKTIDVIINNAGVLIKRPFMELEEIDWAEMFAINLFTPVKLIKSLLPLLSKNSHIVNIGSMAGFLGSQKFAGLAAYSTSKGALATLSESLATELPASIHCNCLAFGSVKTAMFSKTFPGVKAGMSDNEAGEFVADFALTKQKFFNGKVLPITSTTP